MTIAEINAALAPADQALARAYQYNLDAFQNRNNAAALTSARSAVTEVLTVGLPYSSPLYAVMRYVDNPGAFDSALKVFFDTIHDANAKVNAITLACAAYQGGPMLVDCFLQKAVKTSNAPIGAMVIALQQVIAAARPPAPPVVTQLPHARISSSAPLPGWHARIPSSAPLPGWHGQEFAQSAIAESAIAQAAQALELKRRSAFGQVEAQRPVQRPVQLPPRCPVPFGAAPGAIGGSYDWWWCTFGRAAGMPYAPPLR